MQPKSIFIFPLLFISLVFAQGKFGGGNGSGYTQAVVALNPLPVEWLHFSATAQNDGHLLEWATSQETQNAGFEIQRSQEGTPFIPIGFVPGKGTHTGETTYTFFDANPGSATVFYRLAQQDQSGAVHYSQIVEVHPPLQSESLRLYPTPFTSLLHLEAENRDQPVRIWNQFGQVVYEAESLPTQLDLSHLPVGMYGFSTPGHRQQLLKQ